MHTPRGSRVSRRSMLAAGASLTAATAFPTPLLAADSPAPVGRLPKLGVSTYSFWQFRQEPAPIADCIDKAAAMAAHKSFVTGAISHYNSGNF